MVPDPEIRILLNAVFSDANVVVETVASSRDRSFDHTLDAAWVGEKNRLGDRLFNGPMARLESFEIVNRQLMLYVSQTNYRAFVNSNLHGPPDLPAAACANPIGVSAAVETADDFLVFGLRGEGVAYYPRRLHPFAGSLEWPTDNRKIDVFAECRRELYEELRIVDEEISSLHLIGIAQDHRLRHPELILHAVCRLTADELSDRLQPEEHDAIERVPVGPNAVHERFTPIARATLQLVRGRLGNRGV